MKRGKVIVETLLLQKLDVNFYFLINSDDTKILNLARI